MITKFVEATQAAEGGFNWGKFMVGLFDEDEWARPSEMHARVALDPTSEVRMAEPSVSLLRARGWSRSHVLILDLETGEGAVFLPGGMPSADLNKHRVWVCPMFEPFLEWLYRRARELPGFQGAAPVWWLELPAFVELPDAPAAMRGYRRAGPSE